MTPQDVGIALGSLLTGVLGMKLRGKADTNGHVKRAEYHDLRDAVNRHGFQLTDLSAQVQHVNETTQAIQEDLTNLRIDLGAKR